MNIKFIKCKNRTEVRKMTKYKFITTNNDGSENNSSATSMPAENRKRHKPIRGLPRLEK